MNHIAERPALRGDPDSVVDDLGSEPDPVASVAAAVEANLALAHEQGRQDQVRLLHAVLALLSAAAPRH